MFFRNFTLLVFIFSVSKSAFAVADSTKTIEKPYAPRYFYDYSFDTSSKNILIVDTLLTGVQQYNPIYKNFYSNTGNLGLAHQSFIFKTPTTLGFDYGMHSFDLYEQNSKQIKYFDTKMPYTRINATLGSKIEQFVQLEHNQNINKNWGFGFNIDKIRSEGFYKNQKTKTTGLSFHTNYISPKKKYGILANTTYNKMELNENGGLLNDTALERFSTIPRNVQRFDSRALQVNFDDANNVNIRKSKSFFVKQFFNFGKVDSARINDTIYQKDYFAKRGFSHSFFYEEKSFIYNAPVRSNNEKFYSYYFMNPVKTFDSTHYSTVENEIRWSNYNSKFLYSAFVKHQFIKTHNSLKDSAFDNVLVGGELKKGNQENYYWNFSPTYIVSGMNKGDHNITGNLKLFFNPKIGDINFTGIWQKRSPDFIQKNYFSNHYIWNNKFDAVVITSGKMEYNNEKIKFKTGTSISKIDYYIYFNENATPAQLRDKDGSIPISVTSAWLQKDLKVGKWNLNSILFYQKAGDTIIRVPQFVMRNSFFFESYLFKKALLLQVGTDFFYFTEYFGNAYNPATSQFYLQNEKKIGNYPFLDFFLNIKVKQARIFFKTDHLNAGLMGNTYYMVPHYPIAGRALKLGVSWIFFN